MPSTTATSAERREPTLRLIILAKLIKAIVVLTTAVFFAVLLATGSSVHLHGFARDVREHVTAAWSVYLADAIVSATERRHLMVATCALFLDGASTSVEWYALSRGHLWGEWLVVAATSSLLPFEIAALVREQHAGRFVVLFVNVAIVAYLAHHALAKRRRATQSPAATAAA